MSKVVEYLDRKNIKYRGSGAQLSACCPFCEDTEYKLSIHADTGLWKCWHANRCGKSGTFWQLQKELGDEPMRVKALSQTVYRRPQPEERKADDAVKQWLAARKITAETMADFKISTSRRDFGGKQEQCVVFPYYCAGVLVNFKHRSLVDKKHQMQEKDAEPALFGQDLVPDNAEALLIVEGEPDAMAGWQYTKGQNIGVVSVPSGASDARWIETQWEFLTRFRRLLLCLDMDKAGEKGVQAIIKRLGWSWDLHRVKLPHKDLNDCLIAGVSAADVCKCILDARFLGPEEVKFLRDLPEDAFEEPSEGVECAIPGLQEKLGGWRPGELTIHAGEGASGKTTATCQEIGRRLRSGDRVCMASLEMPVQWLVAIMVKQARMTRPQFRTQYGDRLLYLDVERGVTMDRLMELLGYVTHRYGVSHIVIDSLGCLALPTSDYWMQQKEAVGRFVGFARENGTHVHLVHHLRKPGKNATGRTNHADLEGSAWIRNLADNVILYRRIRDDDRERKPGLLGVDAILYLDKNRMLGTEGSMDLRFDQETRLFGRCSVLPDEE